MLCCLLCVVAIARRLWLNTVLFLLAALVVLCLTFLPRLLMVYFPELRFAYFYGNYFATLGSGALIPL